ncbi:30S ribosomal protein S4, partial [Candidatus Bathyarchaeota archaeon CG_4_8_14_3_um_filter_42_8]
HVTIGNQRVTIPGYIVTKEEENQIAYTPKSPFSNPSHPLRQTIAVAVTPETKSRATRTEKE